MTIAPKFALIFLLASLLVFFSSADGEHLSVKTYTIADGLARDYVNRIKQDPDGYIWFCTSEGISRFDGYSFKNYGTGEGLPHRNVSDILVMHDGTYLFGTEGGLVQFDPEQIDANGSHFTRIDLGSDANSNAVTAIVEDGDGSVWCGTAAGVFHITRSGSRWEPARLDDGPENRGSIVDVGALYVDRNNSLWIGTGRNGLFRRPADQTIERYTTGNGLAQNGISRVYQDREGTIWVGTGDGLTRLVDDPKPNTTISAKNYSTSDGLLSNFIETIFQSSDGRLWVGTRGGVNYLSSSTQPGGKTFRVYGPANGLPNIRIITIAEDRDNNLWIGGENGGAMKIPLNGFVSFLESDGFGNGRIAQIFADRSDRVYALAIEPGSLKPSILSYDGSGFVRERPDLPSNVTFTWGWDHLIVQDIERDWWLPTARGIYRFSANGSGSPLTGSKLKKIYGTRDGIANEGIFRLFEDTAGDIWFGTLGDPTASLNRLDRKTDKLTIFTPADNIPMSGPTAFANGPSGDIWIGFYTGGLARYRDGRFTQYTTADGLPAGMVRHLFFDSKKRLWIGTSVGGVGRVDDIDAERPRFESLTTKQGISSDQVTSITEDKWGRIYLGTGRGIDRLDPDGTRLKHYTTADGLPDNFINVSFADSDGVLWFGTLHGLSRYVPRLEGRRSAPPILISDISVAGETRAVSELGGTDVTLPDLGYTQNQVQIGYVSLSDAPGETVRYQYQFEGATDWSLPTDGRSIIFPNLTPGRYRFLVRAINSDGLASETPALVSFNIIPPVWARWWFTALGILFVGGLAFSFYRYRIARLREINAALEEASIAEESLAVSREERIVELERVRSRIATDLHDDIGASLTQIAILSEVAQTQTTHGNGGSQESLEKITRVSNELVGTMSDIVWSINPSKDHLSDLSQRMRRFAADVLAAKKIRLHFQGNENVAETVINSNLRREVFLIFKESINNIVKHASAKNVWADLNVVSGHLKLNIRDDGTGFDPAAVLLDDNGNGLVNMERRTKEMGGVFDIRSSVGASTSIIVSFPIDMVSPAE